MNQEYRDFGDAVERFRATTSSSYAVHIGFELRRDSAGRIYAVDDVKFRRMPIARARAIFDSVRAGNDRAHALCDAAVAMLAADPAPVAAPPALDIDAKLDPRGLRPAAKLERRIVWNLLTHLARAGFPVCSVDDGETGTEVNGDALRGALRGALALLREIGQTVRALDDNADHSEHWTQDGGYIADARYAAACDVLAQLGGK